MFVYKITNLINQKIYIGKTIKKDIKERMKEHIRASKTNKNMPILKAISKYGKENFIIEILFEGKNNEEICEKEKEFIKKYNSMNPIIGYNILSGGEGVVPTPELRKQLSERGKLRIGEKNSFFGKKHSEEAKRKMSEARKGKHINRTMTEEERKKYSERMKQLRKDPIFNKKIKESITYITGEGNKRNLEVKCIELNKIFPSLNIAETELNNMFPDKKFSKNNISNVCRGKKHTHQGFTFEYVDKSIKTKKNNYNKSNSKSCKKVQIIELNKIFNSKKECCEFLYKLENEKYHEKYIKDNIKYKKYTFKIL